MFTPFFYLLKARGLSVSMTQWITLMEALDKGIVGASLTNLYYVGRMILVNSEADFDQYDMAFLEYFEGIKAEGEIPPELSKWLDRPEPQEDQEDENDSLYNKQDSKLDSEEISSMFQERLTEQKSEHNGGNYWIGTSGTSTFGHSGRSPGGIRIGGHSGLRSAFQVVGERKFRDFRQDRALDMRQFQVAFRRLRQFSARLEAPKTELDLDQTIHKTCDNGGYLQLCFDKPRKNTVKLLLLFDSGGTMYPFSTLCNNLFQAVHKANHFKDVKTYYFHNCIYSKLYKNADCEFGDWVDTDWVCQNLDSDYKVIIIGDAAMAPEELYSERGNYRGPNGGLPGIAWLQQVKRKFKKSVWLNPRKHANVEALEWLESEYRIANEFPMFKLTVDGLKEALGYLMVNR